MPYAAAWRGALHGGARLLPVRSNLAARCSSQASKQSRSRTSGQLRPSGLAPCQGATMAALARLRRQVDQCTADCVQAENALNALRATCGEEATCEEEATGSQIY